jgi:hypothetical protein
MARFLTYSPGCHVESVRDVSGRRRRARQGRGRILQRERHGLDRRIVADRHGTIELSVLAIMTPGSHSLANAKKYG